MPKVGDVEAFMRASGQLVGDRGSVNKAPLQQENLYFELIREEYDELMKAAAGPMAANEVEVFDACLDLIWVTIGFMISCGLPIHKGWDEVARSNLAKIDKATGKVIRRPDGKILKPDGWTPPNLAAILKDAGFEIIP